MLAEVIQRLGTEVPILKMVDGAAAFAAVRERPPPKDKQPAAYVIPIREQPRANRGVNYVAQATDIVFGVVLALGNFRDPRGEAASSEVEALRASIRGALLGWQPSAALDPCEYAGGAAVGFVNGVIWWQDLFRTAADYRSS